MENWKRNILEFLHKEELILYIGWNKLLEEWVEEWGDFMGQIKLGNIQINNNGKDIEISLSNDIEQTISLYYFLKFDEKTALYDQILWIEYTLHYDHQTEKYTNTIEEISRKTDPIHEKEFVLSYLNILFINYYTKYNHL